jgi:DNA modification methylase
LLLGDFRERGKEIKSGTVHMIFTDPPYAEKYLPLWNDLGEFAARVLKPGGLLLSYSGIMYLPQVYELLNKHLKYLWTFAIKHSGCNAFVPKVNIHQAWKPIVGYYKPPFNKYWRPFLDLISGGKSKQHHEWEQSTVEAAHFIKAVCPRNGILVDPMMGSGTTLIAALSLNMSINSTGIEIDKATFLTAQERMKKFLNQSTDESINEGK